MHLSTKLAKAIAHITPEESSCAKQGAYYPVEGATATCASL